MPISITLPKMTPEHIVTWQTGGPLVPPEGEGWDCIGWKPGPHICISVPGGVAYGVWVMWQRLVNQPEQNGDTHENSRA